MASMPKRKREAASWPIISGAIEASPPAARGTVEDLAEVPMAEVCVA
jgi:hypothetical protein